jgi:hypothetical protein
LTKKTQDSYALVALKLTLREVSLQMLPYLMSQMMGVNRVMRIMTKNPLMMWNLKAPTENPIMRPMTVMAMMAKGEKHSQATETTTMTQDLMEVTLAMKVEMIPMMTSLLEIALLTPLEMAQVGRQTGTQLIQSRQDLIPGMPLFLLYTQI